MDVFQVIAHAWGFEDFDAESDEDGCLDVTLEQQTYDRRGCVTAEWKLKVIEDLGDKWLVNATCVESDWRRFMVDDMIEFELDKDVELSDLADALEIAAENQNR